VSLQVCAGNIVNMLLSSQQIIRECDIPQEMLDEAELGYVQGNEQILECFLNEQVFSNASLLLNPAIRDFFWTPSSNSPLIYYDID
jgi:hypothetical protein